MAVCRGCQGTGPTGATGPAGATGATGPAGGGGAAPDHHILISSALPEGTLIDSGVPYAVPFDSTAMGGVVYELRGTNATWNIANPTRLTINADGIYDCTCAAGFIEQIPPATAPVGASVSFYLNGVGHFGDSVLSMAAGTGGALLQIGHTHTGWELEAGDYLEVVVTAADPLSGPNVALLFFGAANITQRS